MEQISADGSKGPNGELNSPPEHRGKPEVHTSGLASPALPNSPESSYLFLRPTAKNRATLRARPATISTGTAEPSRR